MLSPFPPTNKLCYERQIEQQHASHRRMLTQARPTCHSNSKHLLDNTPPAKYPHREMNLKGALLELRRIEEINRANILLTQRVHACHRRSPKQARTEFLPGVRLTASQEPVIDHFVSPRPTQRGSAMPIPPKPAYTRRQKQRAIDLANWKLRQGIEHPRGAYSAERWEEEFRMTQQYKRNLARDETVGYLPRPGRQRRMAAVPLARNARGAPPRTLRDADLTDSVLRLSIPRSVPPTPQARSSRSDGAKQGGTEGGMRSEMESLLFVPQLLSPIRPPPHTARYTTSADDRSAM